MLLLPGFFRSASFYKRLFCRNAIASIRDSKFVVLASARSLKTLDGKMAAAESTWDPDFVAVEDTSSPNIDPKCLLRIVSYNILAQAYVKSVNFPHSPRSCLRWKNRSKAVASRLLKLDADILCLQELDEYDSFYKGILDRAGYGSVYVQRGNKKKDGCGILFKRERISLLSEEVVDYNVLVPPPSPGQEVEDEAVEDGSGDEATGRIGDMNDVRVRLKRDCVGILAAFKPLEAPDHIFVLANTHIFWDPLLMDVKLAQVHHLAESLVTFKTRIMEKYKVDPHVFIVGDFNSLPGDSVYNYLVSGTDSTGVEKDLENLVGKLQEVDVNRDLSTESRVKEWLMQRDSSKFPLPVVSLYAHSKEEPPFTNYTHNFVGTLDYILFVPSTRLRPRTLLALPKPGALDVIGGLPNHHHPSDHLPIGSDFAVYDNA